MQDRNQDEYEAGLTPAEQEVARALGRLRPAPARLDRDRLMFQAGRRSMQRTGRLWQAAAAAMAACLFVSIAFRPPAAREVQHIVYAPTAPLRTAAPVLTETPRYSENSYIHIRTAVLERGLDALPTSTVAANGDEMAELRHLLRPWGEAVPPHSGLLDMPGT